MTSRAWASASPTISAFCSPVEECAAGACFGPCQTARSERCGPIERAAGQGVAAAIVAQTRPVAVFGHERGPALDRRLDLALKRKLRPGKGRGIVAPGGDQPLEPAHAVEPGRGDRDPEFGRLALDRVEPGSVAPALLEKPVAPAQSPLELGDPRAVAGVDRQHEAVEKAAPLGRRPGEQRIHRRRQPDDAHVVRERARRGDGHAVDAV